MHPPKDFSFKKFLIMNRWYLLLLLGLVFISYVNALGNSFVSDDRGLVINMPIWDTSTILSNPYPPMRQFLYLVAYKIGGLNPALFRSFNIIFHAGTVMLIYTILCVMQKPKVGILAAALFAVHPILVESITWITAGAHAQYSFFFLLALLFYILPRKNTLNYAVSIGFYILALLSSEKAVVLALAFPLFEFSFGSLIRSWKRIIPYFILSGFWVLLYLRLFTLRIEFFEGPQLIDSTFVNPLLQIPIAITSYLQLIFWPNNLTIYHTELSFTLFEYIVRVIFFIIFLGVAAYCFRRNRLIFFWLTFFLVTLLPTINPFVHAWIVAERYIYLGTIGIVVTVAVIFARLGENLKYKKTIYIVFSFIIFSLAIRTIVRNIDWQNEDNLWLATKETSPSSAQNHNNLGDYYGRHGDLENSVKEFKRAIELKPNYADAYHNLGNAYRDMGRFEDAIKQYEKALSFNPGLWQSYHNIAAIYYSQKSFDRAIDYLQKGITINPQNPNLFVALSIVYFKQGEKSKATEAIATALKIDPNNNFTKEIFLQMQNNTLQ
ncbi:MAG: tetratricopeptide repeat protein [Candidatus Levyibacteriota bacterium]|nr:MAG: tetratricopeptide repeat protein [Candidatus Levybacteria bacterium]